MKAYIKAWWADVKAAWESRHDDVPADVVTYADYVAWRESNERGGTE